MAKDLLLYGRNVLVEALAVGAKISSIFFENESSKKLILSMKGVEGIALKQGLPNDVLGKNHQGVAFVSPHEFYIPTWDYKNFPFNRVLFCNHLEDSQNLGAIIRLATAFDVDLLVHEDRRSVQLNAAAVKVSSGQAFRLQFLRVSNLTNLCVTLKKEGYWIAGLDLSEKAINLYDFEPLSPLALVIGSEEGGLSRPVEKLLDFRLKIPMKDGVESLNAAQAAGIALSYIYGRTNK